MSSLHDLKNLTKIIKPAAAGLMVCTKDDYILLAKRTSSAQFLGGHWSVPSGESNEGETLEDCARREFFEETGHYIPNEIELLEVNKYFDDARTYCLFVCIVEKRFQIQIDFEHDDWGWFKADSLPTPMAPQIVDGISKTSYLLL